jgi:hypothetical protein
MNSEDRVPPGYGAPEFTVADAEAAAFLEFWRLGFLTCAELTGRAARLSPDARRIVIWAVKEVGAAQRSIDRKRADALLHRTMQKTRSADG